MCSSRWRHGSAMSDSLLIYGRDFETVGRRVRSGGAWQPHQCSSVAEFVRVLQSQPDGAIDRLDILDHGGPGFIKMGAEVLFGSDGNPTTDLENRRVVEQIRNKLTPTAHVRLLGCQTATAWFGLHEGRLLVLKLTRLLNADPVAHSRMVFGTINGIDCKDFGPHGLERDKEITLLYSSFTAIDYPSPTYYDRLRHVSAYRAGIVRRSWGFMLRGIGLRVRHLFSAPAVVERSQRDAP